MQFKFNLVQKPLKNLSKLCSEVYRLCEKYEKVEFFHVSRRNSYIQKCYTLCNERLDAKGFKN